MHNGNYATYVARDIVEHVDQSYRTIANAGGRAILGKSSGGFGAMHLVMEKPGVFGAFAAHSADSYYRQSAVPGFVHAQRTLEKHGSIEAFVTAFESKHKTSQSEFVTMEMVAYSAAYSPRSDKAFDVHLPFDIKTGAIRDDIFAQWLAYDPVERVPKKSKELAALRARYIDCGRRDDYGLDIGARLIAQSIGEMGLTVIHEEFDDDHRNTGYRYEISMPALAGVLDKD
jgi:S-formylglutathione hydrolase FrmB